MCVRDKSANNVPYDFGEERGYDHVIVHNELLLSPSLKTPWDLNTKSCDNMENFIAHIWKRLLLPSYLHFIKFPLVNLLNLYMVLTYYT